MTCQNCDNILRSEFDKLDMKLKWELRRKGKPDVAELAKAYDMPRITSKY